MHIVTVIGARPQFIKAAVVSRALAGRGVKEMLVHTGQHYDANMSDVFFDELEIPRPAYNLGIGGGTHGKNTGRMIEAIEQVLLDEKPEKLLVYGDTDSTLAGALAAVKLHIPVVHVEAGLRSFNRRMPEEINRILTDHAAELLLAPTQTAMKHLADEGIPAERCHLVGDVMYDAALYYGKKAEQESRVLEDLGLAPKEYILATVHRAENTDDPFRLKAIMDGFAAVDMPIVLPLHPRTAARVSAAGLQLPQNLQTIDPVGYLDMVQLERQSALIATDSGGVQKEAFFQGVPCVTLRDETEWVELVEGGWNRLVSPKSGQEVATAITQAVGTRGRDITPYGSGQAGAQIAELLNA